mmetsp:Transcript_107418/g.260746  ORF Transcript_107418/g.260746 Transcript_107418/m.260746 type:complete len:390 (+) Transcript_107418:110-1279(+)
MEPDERQVVDHAWEKRLCDECGQEDGPEGNGKCGTGKSSDFWYCGSCWLAWDVKCQEKAGDEDSDAEPLGNFFDHYKGGEGTDEIDGAWDPDEQADRAEGEQALPGSWERPTCAECGNEEGDEGFGRYQRDEKGFRFICGRCWRSWDDESRRRIMMAYAPSCHLDPICPAPEAIAEPQIDCPAPDVPFGDDDDDWIRQLDEGAEEVRDWEGGPDDGPDDWDDVEEAEAVDEAAEKFAEMYWPASSSEPALPAPLPDGSTAEGRDDGEVRDYHDYSWNKQAGSSASQSGGHRGGDGSGGVGGGVGGGASRGDLRNTLGGAPRGRSGSGQEQVASFLRGLDLGKYVGVFKSQEIDVSALQAITDRDLENLGLPLGPRKKIMAAKKTAFRGF